MLSQFLFEGLCELARDPWRQYTQEIGRLQGRPREVIVAHIALLDIFRQAQRATAQFHAVQANNHSAYDAYVETQSQIGTATNSFAPILSFEQWKVSMANWHRHFYLHNGPIASAAANFHAEVHHEIRFAHEMVYRWLLLSPNQRRQLWRVAPSPAQTPMAFMRERIITLTQLLPMVEDIIMQVTHVALDTADPALVQAWRNVLGALRFCAQLVRVLVPCIDPQGVSINGPDFLKYLTTIPTGKHKNPCERLRALALKELSKCEPIIQQTVAKAADIVAKGNTAVSFPAPTEVDDLVKHMQRWCTKGEGGLSANVDVIMGDADTESIFSLPTGASQGQTVQYNALHFLAEVAFQVDGQSQPSDTHEQTQVISSTKVP